MTPRLTLIADPKSVIIRKFGLFNERYSRGSYSYGVAHPIILVLDQNGTVTHRFSNADYYSRPPISLVLKALNSGISNMSP
jgi:peroxiredoxin